VKAHRFGFGVRRPTMGSRSCHCSGPVRLRRLTLEPLEDRRMLAILMVDADAAPGGLGQAWDSAYNDLQDALTQAAALNANADGTDDIEAVWIAEGAYKPSALLETGNARSASFSLLDGVTLYGGFAGIETTLSARDWSTHVTTLSGDLGVSGDNSDNAYTVVFGDATVEAGMDGVSIIEGNADGVYDASHPEGSSGGGLCSGGTVTANGGTTAHGQTATIFMHIS